MAIMAKAVHVLRIAISFDQNLVTVSPVPNLLVRAEPAKCCSSMITMPLDYQQSTHQPTITPVHQKRSHSVFSFGNVCCHFGVEHHSTRNRHVPPHRNPLRLGA